MGAMKRAYASGARPPHPMPAHGGLYRLDGDDGYYWCGQGPRPGYRPTLAQLTKAGIDPAAWLAAHRAGTGMDLADLALELERSPAHAPRMDRAEDRRTLPARHG